jgi:hypothetical protein
MKMELEKIKNPGKLPGFERTVNIIMQSRFYLLQFYQEILL